MPNEHGPEITPIRFTQRAILEVDLWPERTTFGEDWLRNQAHKHGATVLGDTVTFSVANGDAAYHLRYDLDPVNGAIVADLVRHRWIAESAGSVVGVSRGTVG